MRSLTTSRTSSRRSMRSPILSMGTSPTTGGRLYSCTGEGSEPMSSRGRSSPLENSEGVAYSAGGTVSLRAAASLRSRSRSVRARARARLTSGRSTRQFGIESASEIRGIAVPRLSIAWPAREGRRFPAVFAPTRLSRFRLLRLSLCQDRRGRQLERRAEPFDRNRE